MPNVDLLALAYQIFKDFGCNVVLGGIVIFLLWKIATNHLRHIGMDVQANNQKIDDLSKKVESWKEDNDQKIQAVNDKVEAIGERTSKIEGKIGI